MKLSLWTYEGPTHIGAMRIANSMRGAHLVLHAPQGDTYADLLFTMIERQDHRPPVTYTTFQARDLGGDTANLFVSAVQETLDRFKPDVLLVGESCTAELLQDQPGSLTLGMGLSTPVIPVELPAYSRKENFGASETLYAVIRGLLNPSREQTESENAAPVTDGCRERQGRKSVNVLGPTSLGFRCRDDVTEISRLLEQLRIDINTVAPLGASVEDILRIPNADLNICLYPETARTACDWLKREFDQPYIDIVPIGVGATNDFIAAVVDALNIDLPADLARTQSRLPWYSRSIDSNYLTGKRVFIFADASHAIAAARIARDELAFEVVGLGTYSREHARDVRKAAAEYGVEALITDDYLEVEDAVRIAEPELVLGTQMERHMAKRLGIACCVISSPFHVEDCPARYAPQMGFEGANVIFDSWVHPLMMGLEEHLLGMFRDDFEFNDTAAPSHLGSHGIADTSVSSTDFNDKQAVATGDLTAVTHKSAAQGLQQDEGRASRWTPDAEKELKKIPFFIRKKARRNTERFAVERGLPTITLETLYDAKAHFS